MTPSIRIVRAKFFDVVGFDEFEVRPGNVCVASGGNAMNKTNFLRCIRAAFGGGHDAEILRHGAKEGQIVLELSNGYSLETRVRPDKTDRVLKDETGTRLSKPMTRLQKWIEATTLNPIELLHASKSERVKLLARALPFDVDIDRIVEAAGGEPCPGPKGSVSGIELLAHAEEHYFAARRGQKQVRDELRKTEANLARSVADAPNTDELTERREEVRARLQSLRANRERDTSEAKAGSEKALAEVAAQVERELSQIRSEHGGDIGSAQQEKAEKLADFAERIREIERERDAFKAKCDDRIRAIEKQRDERLRAVEETAEEEREAIRQQYAKRQEGAAAQYTTPIEEAAAEESRIDEQLRDAHRLEGVRSTLDDTRTKLEQADARVNRLDTAVSAVRKLRVELMADLPIKDLEVRDGELWYAGTRWDLLEESRQVMLAVDIAAQLAGEIGVIVADGLECLDAGRFRQFCEAVESKGLQLIGTRVSDSNELEFVGSE